MSDKPEEIISGDESVPYESWQKYVEAVEEGVEPAPKVGKISPNEKYAFNVDEALDNIDLTFGGYKPSEQALEFFNIIRLVMGEDPEVDNGLMHYFLVDLVFGNVGRNNFPYSREIQERIRLNEKKIAIIASRFSAKSTVITAFMPIYVAVTGKLPNFGDVMFWVSFGDSQQAGAKVQANTVRDICQDSKFCQEYFEKMRFTDEECEFIRKGEQPLKKRSFMFKVKGAAGGSVRGIRYRTERPQIFTFDDIIKNEADANSPVIMAKLRSMIYSDAENATGRKGKIIIVNTPFNKSDPVYSALESGVWTPIALPICEKISLDLKKSEYRGSWEAMKSYEDVMEKYEDAYHGGTLREFNQELMLRISAAEDKLVKDDQIQWYSRRTLEQHIHGYNIYMTTDLTASNSLKGDFSCVMTWAVNSNGDWFMLDASVKRQTISDQYVPILHSVRRWGSKYGRHVYVGVEVDGQQQLNVHSLKKMMLEHNTFFSFVSQIGSPESKEGISRRQATGAKHEQFMRVHPLFQQKKIYFPEELKDTPDMKEILNELKYITYEGIGSKHDDALDCISMIAAMNVIYPSDDAMYEPTGYGEDRTDYMWQKYPIEEEYVGGSTVF
jgi:phage terminase large subunit-like protein